jgi:anaphase-promoting complex subunit 3
MGLVYLKTGKPKYAEHHFRRAAEINPTNAVLLCCIGMVSPDCTWVVSGSRMRVLTQSQVLEQTDDIVGAFGAYDEACKYAPDSPMVQFKRIRMLVALQRIDVGTRFSLWLLWLRPALGHLAWPSLLYPLFPLPISLPFPAIPSP